VALWEFLGENYYFFEILIFTIHYDFSFYMVLDYDMWQNKKLSHGILIEIGKIKKSI